MGSPVLHIAKFRSDMRTFERLNERWLSWHSCSVMCELGPVYLSKFWIYCLRRWMSSSLSRMTRSMQSRHQQVRFRKIQKLGMLHARSQSLHLTGVAASGKQKRLLCMPDQLAESVGTVFSYFSLCFSSPALPLDSLLVSSIR